MRLGKGRLSQDEVMSDNVKGYIYWLKLTYIRLGLSDTRSKMKIGRRKSRNLNLKFYTRRIRWRWKTWIQST